MNEPFNPYQAPDSDPQQRQAEADPPPEAIPFFTAGPLKLVAMSLCTLGLYHIYWFYKNWVRIKHRQNSAIVPLARGIFSVIYCYPCFKVLADTAREHRLPTFQAGATATIYILLQFTARLPNEKASLMVFFAFIPMLMANQTAMQINDSIGPELNTNTRLRGWNWVAVVLLGPLLVLGLFGLLSAKV